MKLLEYIDKYKNYTMDEVKFNDIDNIILSSISYIDFDRIVSKHFYKKLALNDVCLEYFLNYTKRKNTITAYRHALEVLEAIYNTKRYGDLLLYNYSYIGDSSQQFSAITIELNRNLVYVSFEGTDHLISGWEEDFKMAYMFPVKAQKHAVRYLNRFTLSNKKIIVGGHSKGGNLALVAGMYANILVRNKIIRVYSNDGPGVRREQYNSARYVEVSKKLISIIPNYSFVGLILRHSNNYKVVSSSKKGILAHDLINWQVEDDDFMYTELSTFSKIFDKSMREWLTKYDDLQREIFVSSLFAVFRRAGVNSIVEVMDNKKIILKLIFDSRNIDKLTKQMLREFVWVLFEYAKNYKEL